MHEKPWLNIFKVGSLLPASQHSGILKSKKYGKLVLLLLEF